MGEFKYVGSELDLFAAVHNWKSYWSGKIRPFIQGDVLEIGAGIGSNTVFLDRVPRRRWVCLEPDESLLAQIRDNVQQARSEPVEVVCGTLQSVQSERFDTLIYIDVLEHIENDQAELELAASMLRDGGRIIVLSPAHQFLFTAFDSAIGHFRRYDTTMMRTLTPSTVCLDRLFYLDSAGMMLSLANRMLLKQSMPTQQQLGFWDRCVIPFSRALDPLLFGSFGKSIVAIWKKPVGGAK